uniref:TOG array regulator of axonemal microtubules 1 n=1 Tax=Anser brachyrhynchus TaxID=132585 RepID=A0A8B9D4C7_9AVES
GQGGCPGTATSPWAAPRTRVAAGPWRRRRVGGALPGARPEPGRPWAPPPPPARAMQQPPRGPAGDGARRPREGARGEAPPGRRRGTARPAAGPEPGPEPGPDPSPGPAAADPGPEPDPGPDPGPVPSRPLQPRPPEEAAPPGAAPLRFGLLPAELHGRLLEQRDYRGRARAVEELKRLLGAAEQGALASAPAGSLLGLLGLLCALLDDPNFRVVLGALQAVRLLALRLAARLPAFLAPLVAAAAKVLGDAKLPIRREHRRLLLRLMEAAGPRPVLGLLLRREHLRHRNSRVREEVVNVCIAALLTYPGEDLDLAELAFGLAPALVDGKRRVRHAALEAFAALAAAMGPGNTALLFRAVDAVELEADGDGVMHAVQARLARKALPRLAEEGFVEYAVPLPSAGHSRASGLPQGADTDWLLAGGRTQSAHSYCGYHARDAPQTSGSPADQGVSPRRVLSAGKGKNKLPWESERAADKEGGSGGTMTSTKGVEQFSPSNDFLHSPKLRPSQGMPVSEELFFSRKRPPRNLFQNSIDFNSEHSSVCAGAMGSHQPHISGKCGTLGCTQTHGKSGSVDSDLQFLGLNNCQQDKVCASLNFSSKTQRSFCNQAEHTLSFQGPNASQGAFILPSYPLSSPRTSPKHVSPPADSPKKSQDNTMNFSNSWPLKSFEGLPKPSSQKHLRSQKSGDNTGDNLQEKHSPLQLKPTLVRHPASRRGLNGTRPVPPIPRLASPLPDKIELSVTKWKNEECEDVWVNEGGRKLAADLSELTLDGEEVDQEEMQSSLRSLRNSAAKKRAKLSSNISDLESPDSALKLDLSGDSPSHASSPSVGSCSESGVYSQESLTSPISTVPQRKRIIVLSEDAVVIVGKGVFGSPSSAQTHSQSITCAENGDDQSVKQETEPSSGICRRSIQHSSASHFHAENEKEIKVALSKSVQDKMRQKKKEGKEQNHKEHQEVKDLEEKEEKSWERLKLNEPEKTTTENEISLGPRGRYKDRTPSVTHSPEIMDPSELQPFSKPETALTEALVLLADDDWEKKIEGLNFVRCLSAYHAAILTVKLHETSLAVAQEVKNLRSGVSRAAVVCLGDLFTHLKKSMDQELDNTVKVLLHKAGESNTFIREEVDKALKAMVNNVTPARALCSLINGGQSHLHAAVRRCTAQHMSDIVERMGPEWMLAGTKVVTDRIFPAIARFALDSSQQTRYYGRKMLFSMMNHPDFDKTLEKYVPAKDLPYIKEFVSNLRQKGLGEMPLDTPSAKGRRSHTSIVGHSRSSSTSRDALKTTEAREVTRKAAPRNSIESEEYVKDIIGLLNAKDFRDRINGINQLLSDTENNQDFVVANIVKIFDAFKPRLHDSNSKVNQVALETMYKMIPLLKDNLSPVINMLVPAMVDNNLNSKNPGIYAAATNVIQALCQHLDNYLLLQPFCTKAQFLHGKAKQDITEKLADLVAELYPRKPQAVEQKVLAVLWHLLGAATSGGSAPGAGGSIRTATAKLSRALFAHMGPSLLAHAAAQPPHVRRSLEECLELAA